jgi:hypothetical protein
VLGWFVVRAEESRVEFFGFAFPLPMAEFTTSLPDTFFRAVQEGRNIR